MGRAASPRPGTGSIRACHVLGELRPSGAERMLAVAAEEFVRAGCRCDILALGGRAGPYASALREVGYEVHHGCSQRRIDYLRKLWQHVGRDRYDVVHLHMERMSFWLAMGCRARGLRVVRSVHSLYPYRGRLRWYRLVQRALLRRLGVVQVAVSDAVAAHEARRLRNPCVVVENWLDVAGFEPVTERERVLVRAELQLPADRLVLVAVGNCAPVKNHEFLIEALAHLPEATLLHLGQEAGAGERELAAARGVSMHFLGARADVARLLAAGDVYVTSSLVEGAGIALLEALARGLPAVLPDRPGLREYAQWPGVRVEALEPARFAKAVAAVAATRSNGGAAELHRRAEAVRARYAPARGVSAYARLYRGLADPTSPESVRAADDRPGRE